MWFFFFFFLDGPVAAELNLRIRLQCNRTQMPVIIFLVLMQITATDPSRDLKDLPVTVHGH